ncbi:hypothetical protein B0H14DRAFT_3156388 [Mycena olivaceomarginata]|nr:hypothetical protein B0H14DRAFT_3156388 [Mycena olivaceomarginata]
MCEGAATAYHRPEWQGQRSATEGAESQPTAYNRPGWQGPTLGDLHALVVGLQTRMAAQEDKIAVQENKIAALEQENSKFMAGNTSAREDKKALETFSLVCFRWMYITRKVLFARIPLDLRQVILWANKRQLLPLLDNPRCTLFPHVRALTIRIEYGHGTPDDDDESDDDDDDEKPMTAAAWLDHFFLHINKFTTLSSLGGSQSCQFPVDSRSIQEVILIRFCALNRTRIER